MNKDDEPTLFVGGPMDGRARRCVRYLDYLDIPIINRNGPQNNEDFVGIETHRYRRVRFSNHMSVFASANYSNDDVIRYLILGYRQP
jgi:hypothetical protein